MISKNTFALLAVCLIIILGIKIPQTHAQSSTDEQIPSDLALDLDLANKNPAPNQKVIADVQTEKAQITTNTGEKLDLPIKEAIPEEIKTQSSKDAVNPEQTTSEQVVEKNVQEPVSQAKSSDNLSGTNTVNDSQQDNNQAGKNTIPGTNIQEPDDNAAPTPTPTPEGSNTIPPENGVAPTPADTTAPAPETPAPVVQAVSTGPNISWFRQFINKLLR